MTPDQRNEVLDSLGAMPSERASRTGRSGYGESPIRIYRRQDIRAIRVTLLQGEAPVELAVAHVDLYFFYDVDVVVLVFELFANDLPLTVVQEFVHRFGRAYPAGWSAAGEWPPSKDHRPPCEIGKSGGLRRVVQDRGSSQTFPV